MEDFFKDHDCEKFIVRAYEYIPAEEAFTVEELYQAFKARMLREMADLSDNAAKN